MSAMADPATTRAQPNRNVSSRLPVRGSTSLLWRVLTGTVGSGANGSVVAGTHSGLSAGRVKSNPQGAGVTTVVVGATGSVVVAGAVVATTTVVVVGAVEVVAGVVVVVGRGGDRDPDKGKYGDEKLTLHGLPAFG